MPPCTSRYSVSVDNQCDRRRTSYAHSCFSSTCRLWLPPREFKTTQNLHPQYFGITNSQICGGRTFWRVIEFRSLLPCCNATVHWSPHFHSSFAPWWLGSLVVRASDLRLSCSEFDPRPPHYRSVGTGMGTILRTSN